MEKLNAPLYNRLKKYSTSQNRFHMPGHAGKNLDNDLFSCSKYDFTELSFSDNLNCPNDVILQAESLMAKTYGVANSLFFTAGATSAIFAGIGALSKKTKKVLVDSFSHKSIFQALRHFGMQAILLPRKYDDENCPIAINSDYLNSFLTKDIGAVVLTSPDYFGNVSDIKKICDLAHKKNMLVFVDEAQGSHFVFSELFPKSATNYGDIVVSSLHKTLPVFTGGAVLHLNVDLDKQAKFERASLHTSSPSYLTMASLDYARAYFDKFGKDLYQKLQNEIDDFIVNNQNYNFRFVSEKNHDFSRLVFNADYDELEKNDIYAEMSWNENSVLIATPQNLSAFDNLANAMKKIKPKNKQTSKNWLSSLNFELTIEKTNNETEFIPFDENAIGRVLATDIGCYPPGTPICFYGEKLSKDKFQFLSQHKNSVFNLVENQICVIMGCKEKYLEN